MVACELKPYLRAYCHKPVTLRLWKVYRTHDGVLRLPGRLCEDCAQAIVNEHPGSYVAKRAGRRT